MIDTVESAASLSEEFPLTRMAREGIIGWLAVGALVAAWDIWAAMTGHETLSSAYSRSLQSRKGRIATTVATAYLIAHLQGRPRALHHIDPLHLAGHAVRKIRV